MEGEIDFVFIGQNDAPVGVAQLFVASCESNGFLSFTYSRPSQP